MPMSERDFIAIGDVVTDAFITIKDARVHCNIDEKDCELCVRFGDKVPYESVVVVPAVGNSANAAVCAARLGLSAAFVTDMGDDNIGERNLAAFGTEGVGTEFVTTHRGAASNYHYVLRYEAERTILIKHHAYERQVPDLGNPKWVYLSSPGEDSLPFHMALADYLDQHRAVHLAFQPGTFQIRFGHDKLERIYRRAHLFFCNKDEAQRILDTDETDMRKLLKKIRGLGPRTAVITDGPKGAYADDGTHTWFTPMYPDPHPPVDRTGAGDAFSATFTVAVALGKKVPEALAWGPVNAMSVVQYIGAREGLLSREKLERHFADASSVYT